MGAALRAGHFDCVKLLIESGVSVDRTVLSGSAKKQVNATTLSCAVPLKPLFYCIQTMEMFEYLLGKITRHVTLTQSDLEHTLSEAVYAHNIDIVRYLVHTGVKPTADIIGTCVYYGHIDVRSSHSLHFILTLRLFLPI